MMMYNSTNSILPNEKVERQTAELCTMHLFYCPLALLWLSYGATTDPAAASAHVPTERSWSFRLFVRSFFLLFVLSFLHSLVANLRSTNCLPCLFTYSFSQFLCKADFDKTLIPLTGPLPTPPPYTHTHTPLNFTGKIETTKFKMRRR